MTDKLDELREKHRELEEELADCWDAEPPEDDAEARERWESDCEAAGLRLGVLDDEIAELSGYTVPKAEKTGDGGKLTASNGYRLALLLKLLYAEGIAETVVGNTMTPDGRLLFTVQVTADGETFDRLARRYAELVS